MYYEKENGKPNHRLEGVGERRGGGLFPSAGGGLLPIGGGAPDADACAGEAAAAFATPAPTSSGGGTFPPAAAPGAGDEVELEAVAVWGAAVEVGAINCVVFGGAGGGGVRLGTRGSVRCSTTKSGGK